MKEGIKMSIKAECKNRKTKYTPLLFFHIQTAKSDKDIII